jgi:hypothetical protein
MGKFSVYDYVTIVAKNEWHGYVGIITEIRNGYIHIRCIQRAAELYLVGQDNINDIELYA